MCLKIEQLWGCFIMASVFGVTHLSLMGQFLILLLTDYLRIEVMMLFLAVPASVYYLMHSIC